MKIIALSVCAALASFAGSALADEGLTQGPASASEAPCGALAGSARIDCEQRALGPDDGNQFNEKQFGTFGAAELSGAASGSIESAQDNQDQSSRQASASRNRADAVARQADICPRE
jgi:hypothetical protein